MKNYNERKIAALQKELKTTKEDLTNIAIRNTELKSSLQTIIANNEKVEEMLKDQIRQKTNIIENLTNKVTLLEKTIYIVEKLIDKKG